MCIACAWGKYFVLAPEAGTSSGVSRRGALKATAAFGAAALSGSLFSAEAVAAPATGDTPDLVFHNGTVHTVDPTQPSAEAVAVTGNRITFVGAESEALKLAGPHTRLVDLKGGMLLPGFVEAHIHPYVGSVATQGVDLQYDTRDEILAALHAYAAIAPAGPIRGFGWRYSAFPATGPTRRDLDAIWPDRPVLLIAIDGHSAWTNSKGLALAGITKSSPDPLPGFSTFQRDSSGEPTGFLVEVPAMMTVLAKATPVTLDAIAGALGAWMPKASAAGITTVFDAGIQLVPEAVGFGLYQQHEKSGTLPFRVVGSYYHNNPAIDPIPIIQKLRADFQSPLVRASILKLNMDGVDASYTAAMLAPYSDKPSTSGETILPHDLVKSIVTRADADGIDIHVHCIGDRSTRWTLDAVEAAIAANPPRDRRHTIAHLQGVDPADIPRFAKLGVLCEFSPQWAVPDIYWRNVTISRWGDERSNRLYPYGSMLREGVHVAFGTDWPAASNYSTYKPLEAIEIATTRKELGKPEQTPLPHPDERITLAEAIHANTMGGAYQLRMEHEVGSITVGKFADLVVVEKNLFTVKPEAIHETRIVMTVMDGRVRHEVG